MAVLHNLQASPSAQDILRALQRTTVPYLIHPDKTNRSRISIPHLPPNAIPAPTSISNQLSDIGLKHTHVEELSTTYFKLATNLHTRCEESLRNAMQALASNGLLMDEQVKQLIQTWSTIYSTQMRSWAESVLSHAREAVKQPRASQDVKETKKVGFNHEYTPLLEKYFEYNAYPSAPDRAALARKSMMTPRQIEVWFQNHRNRAKKEGKKLRKLTSDPLPLKLSLESLEQSMPLFVVPPKEQADAARSVYSEQEPSSDEDDDDQIGSHKTDNHITLNPEVPPHAFPTPYPPSCDYVLFSVENGGYKFPPPVWRRTPASSPVVHAPFDFNDLVATFALKLSFGEAPYKKSSRRSTPPSRQSAPASQPWFAATRTVAPPAPHPSLIRPSISAYLTSTSPRPLHVVPAPLSRLRPFQSPGPQAQPATLVPPQSISQSTTMVRRKVARLPKRTPKNPILAHRGASPAMSTASPSSTSRSLSSSSRMSSFSSDTPSSRPSSSSGSSSSSPSTVATPVISATSLPEGVQSPSVSISGLDFDSDDMDDLFGDSAIGGMASAEGLRLNFHAETALCQQPPTKQPFSFSFATPMPVSHVRSPS